MHNAANLVLRRERDRERLAALLPGGSPERPIVVAFTAVIEPRVLRMSCVHCGGEYRLFDHERPAPGVRRVDVGCRQCSATRSFWFRLVDREPS